VARKERTGSPHYDVEMPGFKYNMMDLQAAIGWHQLARLEEHLQRRTAIWRAYDEALGDLPVTRPAPIAAGDLHARHLYNILVNPESGWSRDNLMAALKHEASRQAYTFARCTYSRIT